MAVGRELDARAFRCSLDEDAPLPGKKTEEEKKKEEQEDKSKKKERESPDLTKELVTNDGATTSAPVSRFMVSPPPFKEKFTKLALLDKKL